MATPYTALIKDQAFKFKEAKLQCRIWNANSDDSGPGLILVSPGDFADNKLKWLITKLETENRLHSVVLDEIHEWPLNYQVLVHCS
jgi:hypothetical protein